MPVNASPSGGGAAGRRRWPRPGDLRSLLLQAAIVFTVFAVMIFLVRTTLANLETRGIATGFGFLFRPVAMPIASSWLSFVPGVDTYGRAIFIGILNTLWISFLVIVGATLVGTLVGISRLSSNWLLSRSCGAYVEAIRNVPVLLQLVFWYQLLLQLPPPRAALRIVSGVFISNRGIRYPAVELDTGSLAALVTLAICAAAAVAIAWRSGRRPPAGRRWPRALLLAALVLLPPAAVFVLAGAAPQWTVPELKGFNFRGGGTLSPELAALAIGLTIYASSFIAEIVRAGISGVPSGQWEAAGSLGLKRSTTLRKVVLPQALRIIVPPLTSEYLGIVKNSSLAIAVGYPDLVAIVNTMISDTGQAVEGVAIIMAAFLVISMAMSALMNWYNARVALVAR
jgi:general L-amino acid transport system permease protein